MRNSVIYLICFLNLLIIGCSSNKSTDNTHATAPAVVEDKVYNEIEIKNIQKIKSIYNEVYNQILSGDKGKILKALKRVEGVVLSENNLRNPTFKTEKGIEQNFGKLVEIYTYGMYKLIEMKSNEANFKQLLKNYEATVFTNCKIKDKSCEFLPVFRSSYDVSILHYLLKIRVNKLKEKAKSVGKSEIKDTIFKLSILEDMGESDSNIIKKFEYKFFIFVFQIHWE